MKETGYPDINKNFFEDLEACCHLVAQKYSAKEVPLWSNIDYVRLSGVIYRQTHVQISASTLKRVFGKFRTTERYYPQQATRDALALYGGFKDWDHFVQANSGPPKEKTTGPDHVEPVPPIQTAIADIVPETPDRQRMRRRIIFAIIVLVLAVGLFMIFRGKGADTWPNFAGVRIQCTNAEGTAPHSAIFQLLVPAGFTGNSHHFSLHFGDGKEQAAIANGKLSHYYELPGRYYAFLKYEEVVLDTIVVYLKTTGWEVVSDMEKDTTRVYPVPIDQLVKTSALTVSSGQLHQSGIDTNHTFFVHFSQVQAFEIDADNFELGLRLRTSAARPGVRCSQVMVEVYGERAKHSFMFLHPGCVSWSHLTFSEMHKDGATNDLSCMGADLSVGGVIKLQVENKKATLFVNDKPVYSGSYKQPLHTIYGLRIAFAGIGAIDSVGMKDLNNGIFYSDDFVH